MKLRTSGFLYILVFLLLAFATNTAFSREMPIRRVPLNDEIGLLDGQMALEVKRISQLLYRDFKSEMAVLIIDSTDGVNHNEYAQRVFNHWTLGQDGINNGMLILFAIDDRRVEIMPGIRYKNRFNSSFCNSLMTRHVVPEMKAGRPAQGVLVAAREVAAEIRQIEEGNGATSNSSVGEAAPGIDQSSSSQGSKHYSGSSSSSRSSDSDNSASSGYDSSSASNYTNPLKSPIVRFTLYIALAIWIAGGIFYFVRAFNHGQLMMSPWLFIILMLLSGFIIAVVASKAFDLADNTLDQVFSGTGGASLIGFLWCFSHICPRCNKYMMVHTRTLHYATYYSSGLGEKTEHCNNCGHHRVSTYTIPRKTRSSRSSSSSGGGGRSSGGGGGASW